MLSWYSVLHSSHWCCALSTSIIKGYMFSDSDDDTELLPKWHVYVTGHSLGGALATLLALELSASQLAK